MVFTEGFRCMDGVGVGMAEEEQRTNKAGRDMDGEGRFVKKFDKEDVMDVFDMVEGPVIVAGDVAEAYDSGAETARRRLRELHADGRVKKRKARKRVLWWRADEDKDSPDVADVLAGNDSETLLKLLSLNLGEAITVGDTVYENGDTHSVSES
jgi:hypothetical protein